MKMTFKDTLAAIVLTGTSLAIAVPVFAQDAPPPAGMEAGPGAGMGAGPMSDGPMMGGQRGAMFDFAKYDTDGDGKITQDEIRAVRAAEAAALDANGDGKISAEELVAQEMAGVQARVEARVKARIAAQDADGDGMLSAAELASRPMPMMMFDRFDTDNDGAISTAEMEAAKARMQDRMGKKGKAKGDHDRRGHNHKMHQNWN
ncbi:EF-hand domain-containing protein [Phaeovulum sp.]|uniref:EF-hand domain-containing protein n=1 Tax=Phaeovulum sp. TaxID=2934796 RepID=UPI0039E558D9